MPAPTPVLLRPAIIELRYPDAATFARAADLYELILVDKEKETRTGTACTFVVGSAGTADKKDILLRLTYPTKLDAADGGTILYWEVAGASREDLKKVSDILTGDIPALAVKEAPSELTQLPANDGKPTTERGLLKAAEAGSLIGITINPPVPAYTQFALAQHWWASGGIGVAIGAILSLLGRTAWLRIKRRPA